MKLINPGILYQFDSITPPRLPTELDGAIAAYRNRYEQDPKAINLHEATKADLDAAPEPWQSEIKIVVASHVPPGHAWMFAPDVP
jgi:hypothetical protein